MKIHWLLLQLFVIAQPVTIPIPQARCKVFFRKYVFCCFRVKSDSEKNQALREAGFYESY